MIKILAISLIHCTLISFAQNTTVINFEEKMIVSKEMLQKTPPMLRDAIQKQLNNTIILSKVNFKNNTVYYQSIETKKQINVDGEFAKTGNTSHRESETTITSKPVKIKKDFVKQNFTTRSNKKTTTTPLEKAKWVISKKVKKIMNYNCFVATTTYKGQKLEVYFTKEIPGNASPEKLPFINGIILGYKTSTKTSIATQVQFNQPDVKNFFEE